MKNIIMMLCALLVVGSGEYAFGMGGVEGKAPEGKAPEVQKNKSMTDSINSAVKATSDAASAAFKATGDALSSAATATVSVVSSGVKLASDAFTTVTNTAMDVLFGKNQGFIDLDQVAGQAEQRSGTQTQSANLFSNY